MNAPKVVTFLIALVVAVLGVVAAFIAIPFVSTYAFWFVVGGFVILALGCCFKGL